MIFFLGFLFIAPGFWGVNFDPGFSWFTFESRNFTIHFPAAGVPSRERMEFVRKVAGVAENVRQKLMEQGVRVPAAPVHIVIADYYDYYNGYATPFPENTIVIMPFPPANMRSNDDNWLRTLILHEYSHLCQMDQCSGIMSSLRSIIGRIVLPNALMPAWLLEGYAVYNETRFSNFGRLRSAEWRGMLWGAATGGRLLQLDQCNNYQLQQHPQALTPYLYGANFMSFVASRYGYEIWDRFNREKSSRLPFCEWFVIRALTGRPVRSLWNDWQQQLIRQADSVHLFMGRQSLVSLIRIADAGQYIASPVWSRTGTSIYFLAPHSLGENAIKELILGTMSIRTLRSGRILGRLSVSPDGKYLAFAELQSLGSGYYQGDIFIYDLERSRTLQLTRGERASDPDFAPDNVHLVYVSNSDGVSRLKIINYHTGEQRVIAELENHEYFREPRFSPGGGLIAVSIWRTGGYSDIEIIDLKTGWSLPITSDRAHDISPCWSTTGKYLYFISDRNGTYNLYAYAIESRELYQCTNVVTGVFEPAIAPGDQRFALAVLGENGEELAIAALKPRDWSKTGVYEDTYPEVGHHFEPISGPIFYYSAFPTILPKFWLPMVQFLDGWALGAYTLGWDVLRFHRYQCFTGYQLRQRTPVLKLEYELHRYRPVWELEANLTTHHQDIRLGFHYPRVQNRYRQNLGAGIRVVRNPQVKLVIDGFYDFNNLQWFRYQTAPGRGRNYGIIADLSRKTRGPSGNLLRGVFYWKEYTSKMAGNWTLQVRLAGGVSAGNVAKESAFVVENKSGVLGLRGVKTMSGANVLVGGLEMRLPLVWVERGVGLAPLFLSNLHTALFTEGGMVGSGFLPYYDSWDLGFGAEAGADLILAHYLPLRISLGLSTSKFNLPKFQVYLTVNNYLLDELFFQNRLSSLPLL